MDKKKLLIFGGIIGGLIFLILVIYVLFGSSSPAPVQQSGPITLRMWKTFADSSQMDQFISDYQQSHPSVTIEYTKKNCNDAFCTNYQDDLLNALAKGEGPDIFSISNSWLPKYVDKLEAATDKTMTFKDYKNTFVEVLVSDFTRNQKIYGVALSVDSLGLYYNKDLLGTAGIATPPKTWDDLARQTRFLTRTDKGTGYISTSGVALGTSNNVYRPQDILFLFMLQLGAKPWSEDGLIPTFGDQVEFRGQYINPAAEALRFYTSFADPKSSNYTWNARSDQSIDAFVNGRAAMIFGYSFTADTIKQKNPNLNFDVAPVPQPSLEGITIDFANYWGEVVSKQSKHSQAAWDFLKFISSKTELDKYYASNKVPASRRDLIEQQIQDPEIGVFADANLTARSFLKPDEAKMENIIRRAIDNVILKGITVEEAISTAQTQAGELTQFGGQ